MHNSDQQTEGFSLLELSVVLVIIGLLAGSVVVGRDLIRSAGVRSVITGMSQVETAANTFKEKYNALPGDMKNATDYWGQAAASSSTCLTAQTPSSQATCNGDGDRGVGSVAPPNVWNTHEWFLLWKHLANAGLISGAYTGQTGPANFKDAIPGVNVYQTKLENTGFTIALYPENGWGMSAGHYGNTLIFGMAAPGYESAGKALTPEEAVSVDLKLDDGKPGKGKLRGEPPSWAPACTGTDASGNVIYNLSIRNIDCALYWLDFM